MNKRRFTSKGQVVRLPFAFLRVPAFVAAIALAAALAAFALASVSHAQSPPAGYDEAEAQAIDRMLMCPVCPAESIDQAQVPLARQMRQRVREMLAEGADRQEILDFFADRYGQNVLASPPKSGYNLLAWTLPVVMVLAALAGGVLVLRSMTKKGGEIATPMAPGQNADEADENDLQPYLAAVDRSLGTGADSSDSPAPGDSEPDPPNS